MKRFVVFFVVLVLVCTYSGSSAKRKKARTQIARITNEVSENSDDLQRTYIQGKCISDRDPLIYTENFILQNDNGSQVFATMKTHISGHPDVTCVEIISRTNDSKRPIILGGGVGYNHVEIGVIPFFGQGFDFTLRLFGSYFPGNEWKTDTFVGKKEND